MFIASPCGLKVADSVQGECMENKNIIVIGASLGGVEAMRTLVGGFPERFPAAILHVQHLDPNFPSLLPELLADAGPLQVSIPKDIEPLKPGHIYVAPPDHHMLL